MNLISKEKATPERQWTRPEFMRIAESIEQMTGISFPSNRRASAENVMRKVMSKLGMTNPVSLEIGVSRRGAVLEALLNDLTIGESYFFSRGGADSFFVRIALAEMERGMGSRAEAQGVERWMRRRAGAIQHRDHASRERMASRFIDHRHRHFRGAARSRSSGQLFQVVAANALT